MPFVSEQARDILISWCTGTLCALLHYAMLKGGGWECRELVDAMATHVKGLGLQNLETAALYPVEDSVEEIYSTYVYADV